MMIYQVKQIVKCNQQMACYYRHTIFTNCLQLRYILNKNLFYNYLIFKINEHR